MADYISTLLDDNETDTISPTTTIPAIRDANNNYLDNTLMAADLNAAKNGKIAALDSGKVNTSDIYNALDQTNAGKVLDARQGKVLNDAINAISTLHPFEIVFDENYVEGQYSNCNSINHIVSINVLITTLVPINAGLMIGVIPYGYRPSKFLAIASMDLLQASRDSLQINIEPSGAISLYRKDDVAIPANVTIPLNIVYCL